MKKYYLRRELSNIEKYEHIEDYLSVLSKNKKKLLQYMLKFKETVKSGVCSCERLKLRKEMCPFCSNEAQKIFLFFDVNKLKVELEIREHLSLVSLADRKEVGEDISGILTEIKEEKVNLGDCLDFFVKRKKGKENA